MKTTNYKAVITEVTSGKVGMIIANTKNGKYKGMDYIQFSEAVKYISCFTIKIEKI